MAINVSNELRALILEAVRRNDLNGFKQILEENIALKRGLEGWRFVPEGGRNISITILHDAIMKNSGDITQYLVENYPRLLSTSNAIGYYPIHSAYRLHFAKMQEGRANESEFYRILSYLIAADPNVINQEISLSESGEFQLPMAKDTVLHLLLREHMNMFAFGQQQFECLKFILDNGANVNIKNDNNETPIVYLWMSLGTTHNMLFPGRSLHLADDKNKLSFLFQLRVLELFMDRGADLTALDRHVCRLLDPRGIELSQGLPKKEAFKILVEAAKGIAIDQETHEFLNRLSEKVNALDSQPQGVQGPRVSNNSMWNNNNNNNNFSPPTP